jgi:DNA-directed RNA polymerase subunit omega
MMIEPSVNKLTRKMSAYMLVSMSAKRARQLVLGAAPLSNVRSTKEVTLAANEIAEGKIIARKRIEEDGCE